MNLITILLLALGLCFDSFAVSLTYGLGQGRGGRPRFLRFALVLALFQGGMPLIGWALANGFQHLISRVDHWVAFTLLAFLGVRMILEARKEEEDGKQENAAFNLRRTLLLGVATSIDALITGAALGMVSLAVIAHRTQLENMLAAAAIIGAVTFAACAAGIFIGRTAGDRLGKYAETIGGAILIAIGAKVLIEHLFG